MSCRACHNWLQEQFDGASSVGQEPELEQHLRDCYDCAMLSAAARRLHDGLRRLSPPLPPPGLANRISARVCADLAQRRVSEPARPRRQPLRWRARAGLAAAACVLLALGALVSRPRPYSAAPAPVRSIARIQPPQRPPEPAPEPDVPLRDSVAEVGSAVALRVVRAARDTTSFLPAVPSSPMGVPEDIGEPLSSTAQPFYDAGAEVSAGLGPMTDSLRRAAGLFLRELPLGGQAKPG